VAKKARSHLQAMQTQAETIRDPGPRSMVFTALVPFLSLSRQRKAIRESLQAAREIAEDTDRANAYILLLPGLGKQEQCDAVVEALHSTFRIDEAEARGRVLAALVPHMKAFDPVKLYQWWLEVLHAVSTRQRRDLLHALQSLIPVIKVIGGEEAILGIGRSLYRVGGWWS
jgi:hypothetical protein